MRQLISRIQNRAAHVLGLDPSVDAEGIDELALEPVTLGEAGIAGWLPRALALLGRAPELPSVWFCITTVASKRPPAQDALAIAMLENAARGVANARVESGAAWTIAPSSAPCVVK